jgi:hypothetical protein
VFRIPGVRSRRRDRHRGVGAAILMIGVSPHAPGSPRCRRRVCDPPHAHGAELPPGADAVAYSAGFVIATGALHLSGIASPCWALADGPDRGARQPRGIATAGLMFSGGCYDSVVRRTLHRSSPPSHWSRALAC